MMNVEEAEEVYAAWQIGFEDNEARIATALLVLKNNHQKNESSETVVQGDEVVRAVRQP